MGVLPKRRWRYGKAAGLLGVVGEVALRVHVGVVADDLDGVLVGADGTVGTQAVEHAGMVPSGAALTFSPSGREVKVTSSLMPTVKWFFMLAVQVVVHGLDHGGGELLGAQAVAAAHDLDVMRGRHSAAAVHDVLIQRLAQRAGFLGAVQHGDLLARWRAWPPGTARRRRDGTGGPSAGPPCAPLRVEVIDGLFDSVCSRCPCMTMTFSASGAPT